MQSWDRFEDFSDTTCSNQLGILSAVQQGVGEDVISGDGNKLLKLELTALNADITIEELRAERTGVGSDSDVVRIRLENENGNPIVTGTLNNGIATFLPELSLSSNQGQTLYLVLM